jgi:hypothetical protein
MSVVMALVAGAAAAVVARFGGTTLRTRVLIRDP